MGALSVTQAAERLGVNRCTIWAFIKRGELKAFKAGSDCRIEESEIDAYKERNRVVPKGKGQP